MLCWCVCVCVCCTWLLLSVWQDEAVERCSAIEVPKEHCGQRIMVKCLSLKWVPFGIQQPTFISSCSYSLLELQGKLSVFYNYTFYVFQVWNRNRANIWNSCPVWCQGKEKGTFFCPSRWLSLCKTSYVMLRSSLTNQISFVSKRSKWSCGLDHWDKTELKSLDVHFHYHLSFPSLRCFPLISIFPPTDLGEFLLRPELGSDERAA